jgi:uncharacterized protein YbjT (DUF2867 family)
MILVVGATGTLGGHVARLRLAQGRPVRAMTRDPMRASGLVALGAEVVRGDLCDPDSVRNAVRGVRAVVSSSHAMLGTGRNAHERVDDEGQRTLIAAAKEAGVAHFLFISALGASAGHPVDFWRTKERIERVLASSGMHCTIIRPSAFMGVHAYDLIGKAVVTGKRVMLFGAGNNPRNFVAEIDVANLVVAALEDERLQGQPLEIGGPENLTSRQVVATFEKTSNRKATVTHLPLWALRLMAPIAAPMHAGVSRVLKASVVGETTDQRFDVTPLLARFPMTLTRLEEWARTHSSHRAG